MWLENKVIADAYAIALAANTIKVGIQAEISRTYSTSRRLMGRT